MGVLKNDVGRPSNKTIRTRFILKLIGLILVVGLAFFVGYKLSGEKEENKENTKVEEKVSKYDDFDFVKKNYEEFTVDIKNNISTVEAWVEGNELKFLEIGGTTLEFKSNEKFKYITTFNFDHTSPYSNFAALTYDGDLYVLENSVLEDYKITLKKVDYDKKIKKLFIVDEPVDDFTSKPLYVLNEDDELLKVNVTWTNEGIMEYKIEGKYEDRLIMATGCTNGSCYHSLISPKDNTIKLEIFDGTNVTYRDINYNNKKVKIKYLFDLNSTEEYDDLQKLYIVTEDGDLLVTKSGIHRGAGCTDDGCYEFIKLKKSKVTKAELVDSYTLKLTYANGDTEEFKTVYETYNIN